MVDEENESRQPDSGYGAAATLPVGRLRSFHADAFTVTINQRFIITAGSWRPQSEASDHDIIILPTNMVEWWINRSTKGNLLGSFPANTGSWGWRPLHGNISIHSVIPFNKSISQMDVEATSNNESPYVCIAHDPAIDKIDATAIPAGKNAAVPILLDGFIRTTSRSWSDPFSNCRDIETLAVGQRWSRGYKWSQADGRPYQGLTPEPNKFTYMPFDQSGGIVKSNEAVEGISGVPKYQKEGATMIFLPYIEDIAEGASPLSLRAAMTVETSLTAQIVWLNDTVTNFVNSSTAIGKTIDTARNEQLLKLNKTEEDDLGNISGHLYWGNWW